MNKQHVELVGLWAATLAGFMQPIVLILTGVYTAVRLYVLLRYEWPRARAVAKGEVPEVPEVAGE